MSNCGFCQAECGDSFVCPRCVRVTSHNLADMRNHAVELTTVMIKDTAYSEKSDGGKSADPTIAWANMGDRFLADVPGEVERNPIATPYQKQAAAVMRELHATLVQWTRLLNEERGIRLPRNTIPSLAAHLRDNMRILAGHEAAGEFVAEITEIVKRIMQVIDSPPFRARVKVGNCIENIEGHVCPGDVIAYIYADGDMLGKLACVRCKREWEPTDWAKVGPAIVARKEAA